MKHQPVERDQRAPKPSATKPARVGKFLLILVVVAVAVGVSGVMSRRQDDEKLAKWTHEQAIPTVAVTSLKPDTTVKHVVLPGQVEALYSASLHGQVSGYVQSWGRDIGAQVKRGDVLAVIETPELDDRVTQAEGELEKANANFALAKVTAGRWQALRASSAVSQQAIDEKVGDEKAKEAEVSAAKANLSRLRSQKGFAQIVAPFDGVVTARNVDIGSLVKSDSSGGAPLFVVSDISRMRIYVKAPEVYAAALTNGMTAKLRLPEYPARTFAAKIETTSHAIDAKSRSLLVELMADNEEGLLRPGSFTQVSFDLPPDPDAQKLSASALLFRDEATLAATVDKDDRIKLTPIRIARDYGSTVEIEGGLPADARIVLSPPESIQDGDKVRIAAADDRETTTPAKQNIAQTNGKEAK
jgi:RND family efflux transporter MFP subunit